jgi:segregation and condensation protein B
MSSPEDGILAVAEAPPVAAPTPANDEAFLRRALEGLLFITDRPLSAAELGRLVGVRDQDRIVAVVEELRRELEERVLGYRLIAVAEGWQMATRPELAPYVRRLFADRATMRLSTASQETLSIIAYKQPLTRAEIEQIRGVEVIAALETLLEKRLVKVVGRKETVGRPLMYGTTLEFLRHFGLRNLEDLPPIARFGPGETTAAPAAPFMDAAPAASAEPTMDVAPIAEALESVVAVASPTDSGSDTSSAMPRSPEAKDEDGGPLWPK